DVGPVGRELVPPEAIPGVVGDDEGGAVGAKELVDLAGEPARMPELEAVASRGNQLERAPEPVVVAVEAFGELPEDRAELSGLAKRRDRVEEAAEPLLRRK